MSHISRILKMKAHRPFSLPQRPWKYYQEWHEVLFVHWRVPLAPLRELIPREMDIDLFEGQAWVSLVAFDLRKLRPHFIPPFPPMSNFVEINMRTYVIRNGKPGIYFFSLEAQKAVSAWMGRLGIGLPYMKSIICHEDGYFKSVNKKHGFNLWVRYELGEEIKNKSALDKWLTERYCLFWERHGKIMGNDIHHFEWPLQKVEISGMDLHFRFKNLVIERHAPLYNYSKGVYVPTWGQVEQ
ncbi:MAG: YqjF family protein [Candidatus Saccharibacteria bacterium]